MLDVSQVNLKIIKEILNKYIPECEVRVFGSRAGGKPEKYSDIDLAIVGQEKLSRKIMTKLKYAFEESKLSFRVDIVDWHTVSDEFKKVIEKKYENI